MLWVVKATLMRDASKGDEGIDKLVDGEVACTQALADNKGAEFGY